MKYLAILFAMTASIASADSVKVTDLKCGAKARVLKVMGLNAKLTSAAEKSVRCHKIEWNRHVFIGVQYLTVENVSYSEKSRDVKYYDVFQVIGKNLVLRFYDPIEDMTPVWSEYRGFVMMRTKGIGTDGKPVLVNGYVYLPERQEFVDYTLHAMDQGWPEDDRN